MTHYIVCPYSKPEYRDNLVGAIQRQTYKDDAVIPIVVENGPAVGTFPTLEGVVVLQSQAHQSHAKNLAMQWIRDHGDGSWSVFDCDDYYGPDYLKSQIGALEGYDLVGKSFSNMMYVQYGDGLYLNGIGAMDPTRTFTGGAITGKTAHVLPYPVVDVGEDGAWMVEMTRRGVQLNHTGPRHYCYNRSGSGHTWSLPDSMEQRFKSKMISLGGLPIETVNQSPRHLLSKGQTVARVLMLYTPDYIPAAVSVPDVRNYCTVWDYPLTVHTMLIRDDWPAAWNKVLATEMAFNEVPQDEWIMWIDADMVMQRYNAPLESMIDPTKDFMVSTDSRGICTGLYLIRNTPKMRFFFADLLQDLRPEWPWEQNAMKDLLAARPDYAERVGLIPETVVANPTSRVSRPFIMHYWGNGYSRDPEGLLRRMRRDVFYRDSGQSKGRLFF